MELTTVWFVLIAALWTGYFVLEGFDFGVGILLAVLGRNDRERRVLINTIGPVWDGNEVWVITAAGATFAVFPQWYASLFSSLYLPLLVILVALIIRGVAFEYRGKRTEPAWRARWDAAIVAGSALPALLWGVMLAASMRGIALNAAHDYVGTIGQLLTPYNLLGGVTTTALFITHGAMFLALKTTGDIRDRAAALATRAGALTAGLAVGFLAWTLAIRATPAAVVLAVLAALALVGAVLAAGVRREGWAFAGTALSIALLVVALFAARYPDVLPSTVDARYSLTVTNAAASHYPLTVMTWAAGFIAPLVLGYQGWTYWVFRRRIGVSDIPHS
jgi:cytochrome d ubiquinol oxidase subunit II